MRSSDLNGELYSRDLNAAGTTTRGPRSVSRSITGLPSHRNSNPVEGELAKFIRWLWVWHLQLTDAYKKALDELISEGYTIDTIQA
jgi:hypothetical protein